MQKYAFYSAWIEKSFEPNFLNYQIGLHLHHGKASIHRGRPNQLQEHYEKYSQRQMALSAGR